MTLPRLCIGFFGEFILRVEQALHGYQDGHRLLASSTKLSRKAQHLMLGLSDLSGRSFVDGFDEYLTGYSLAESGYYAFAKTWYATEMSRPGCVWTHTLLIQEKQHTRLENLACLVDLFRRPTGAEDTIAYKSALNLEFGWSRVDTIQDPFEMAQVLRLLYEEAMTEPVLVVSRSAIEYQAAVLEIWSQQWPKLRSRFSFCTGSISGRALGGRGLDLQIVPVSSLREIRRNQPSAQVVNVDKKAQGPRWLDMAVKDLLQPNGAGLRTFLKDLAIPGSRELFAPIVDLYELVLHRPGVTIDTVLDWIGDRYSRKTQVRSFKAALLGPDPSLRRVLFPHISEADVLAALLTGEREEMLDTEGLQSEDRICQLWRSDPQTGISVLRKALSASPGPWKSRLVSQLVEALDTSELLELSGQIPGCWAELVEAYPKIAESPELWTLLQDGHEVLIRTLASLDLPVSTTRVIIRAMLEAGVEARPDPLLNSDEDTSVNVILDWADEHGSFDFPYQWRCWLRDRIEQVLSWFSLKDDPSEASAVMITHFVQPSSPALQVRGCTPWARAFRNSDLSASMRDRLSTFLVSLALCSDEPEGAVLVRKGYGDVHQALASSSLNADIWFWLQRNLPRPGWFANWDLCERLRRGVINQFIEHDWEVAELVRAATSREQLTQLLNTCRASSSGQILIRRLRNLLASGEELSDKEGYASLVREYVL